MATGSAFAGCPTGVCEETLFGCCDDGETPASALPKAKRRRRRQAEESGDGERWKDEQTLLKNIFKVRRTPLVMLLMMTVKLREKAKRTVMAQEMLQRKKKERMRRSVKRTRSARTGNSVT